MKRRLLSPSDSKTARGGGDASEHSPPRPGTCGGMRPLGRPCPRAAAGGRQRRGRDPPAPHGERPGAEGPAGRAGAPAGSGERVPAAVHRRFGGQRAPTASPRLPAAGGEGDSEPAAARPALTDKRRASSRGAPKWRGRARRRPSGTARRPPRSPVRRGSAAAAAAAAALPPPGPCGKLSLAAEPPGARLPLPAPPPLIGPPRAQECEPPVKGARGARRRQSPGSAAPLRPPRPDPRRRPPSDAGTAQGCPRISPAGCRRCGRPALPARIALPGGKC